MRVCILWLIASLFTNTAIGETIFTYRTSESNLDARYDYDFELLTLALEKTKQQFGDYTLRASPRMSFPRAIKFAKKDSLPNFIFKQSYTQELAQQLSFIPFPVDLGIVGYRVCFVSKTNKHKLDNITSIEDLKTLTHGHGLGWVDTIILRHQGFIVHEAPAYDGLFAMVAMGRVDLFCRGSNEILDEYNAHKNIKNLAYDKRISFSYPLPRFFFTSKSNKAASERIMKGLETAYNDGSLQSLWLKHYKDSIDFVQLNNRKIFYFDNPMLKGLDPSYKKYLYNPFLITH